MKNIIKTFLMTGLALAATSVLAVATPGSTTGAGSSAGTSNGARVGTPPAPGINGTQNATPLAPAPLQTPQQQTNNNLQNIQNQENAQNQISNQPNQPNQIGSTGQSNQNLPAGHVGY